MRIRFTSGKIRVTHHEAQKWQVMPRKRFSAEQIVTLLRQAEVSNAQGKSALEVCRDAGILLQNYAMSCGEIFCSPNETQIVIEQWQKHDNTIRPHSALNYRPPAPQTFVRLAHDLDGINADDSPSLFPRTD
jgi:hypothetical protein